MSDDSAWLAKLRAGASQPPAVTRVPLWWRDAAIGSVEPDFFSLALQAASIGPQGWVAPVTRDGHPGWEVNGPLTITLAKLARRLRDAGFSHAWRDEELAVCDEEGNVLGRVERGVVRQLGIATLAVHMVGVTPDGRHWVQQRALTKPNDPGLWDTLMGGMVPASDTVMQALERETWEEAGLRREQLRDIDYGGHIETHRPTGRAGYVVERIEWYRCVVPEGVAPANQDGEVAQFALLSADELRTRLRREDFTTEAALIYAAAGAVEG